MQTKNQIQTTSIREVINANGLNLTYEDIAKFEVLVPKARKLLESVLEDLGDPVLVELSTRISSQLMKLDDVLHSDETMQLVFEGHRNVRPQCLSRSAKRFDPERGFRFSKYAMWWIRAAFQEYILKSWSLVKPGTASRSLQRADFKAYQKARYQEEVLIDCISELEVETLKLMKAMASTAPETGSAFYCGKQYEDCRIRGEQPSFLCVVSLIICLLRAVVPDISLGVTKS